MIQNTLIFGALLIAILAVGLRRHRGTDSIAERFVATRKLSWLTLGASMAAAQISADTPLLVAGAVYADGLAGNWFWWISAPGILATLFFFAPLWRRSGVLTEVEIIRLRYGDTAKAQGFRVFKAVMDGVVLNSFVLASNLYAFTLLLEALLGHDRQIGGIDLAGSIGIAFLLIAGTFATLAGFRGLVKTNSLEFGLAIISAAIIAGFALFDLPHGLDSLRGIVPANGHGSVFDVMPADNTTSIFILLGLGWWHSASGRTLLVQRMVASRNEREAGLTVLSFSIFHYLLRPWGWYLVGAAALYYWPHLDQPEWSLPTTAKALLPSSAFGLLAASVALSFVGCVNSRLNLGASYIVNDVAKVIRPALSDRQARMIEIGVTIILSLMAAGIGACHLLTSIRGLYQFLIMMMAGTGFVSIARWYWSGVTIHAEIVSYLMAIIVALLTLAFADIGNASDFAAMSGTNFFVGAVMTIIVSKLSPKSPQELLKAFSSAINPGGPGWKDYQKSSPLNLTNAGVNWLLANVALFSSIFLIADLVAGHLPRSLFFASATCISGYILATRFLRDPRETKER